MRNIDRRNWLKTVGLSSSFVLLGGYETLALNDPKTAIGSGSLARLNANENPYGPSQRVRKNISDNFKYY